MSSRASYHTASLLYMSVLVPHCSAVMRPSRQHAVMSTSVRFCIRILEACPSQSQVLQDRDFAGRLGADQYHRDAFPSRDPDGAVATAQDPCRIPCGLERDRLK